MSFPQRRAVFAFGATAPAAPVDEGGQSEVPGTRAVSMRSRGFWKAAVLATVVVLNPRVEAAADAPPVQPETWTQEVAGTRALSRAAQRFASRASLAELTYYVGADATVAVVVQPETWTQPVQGTAASRQRAAIQRLRGVQQSALWQTLPEEDGPLSVQPDTFPQPVQGTTSTARAAHAFTARAVQTSLYWNPAQDPAPVAVSDQWTQPISGTGALRTVQQRNWRRALILQPFLQQTPEDVDGPLATQPDTYVQPVQGTSSLSRAARRFWALASRPPSSADVTVQAVPEPDTWQPAVVGTGHLRRAAGAWLKNVFKQRNSESDGSTAALGTQEAPYTQRVVGTEALTRRANEARRTARRLQTDLSQALFGFPVPPTGSTASTEIIATADGDVAVVATSVTVSIPITPAFPTPATLTGLRIGDRIVVALPLSFVNWTLVGFDAAILRFDGPGTLGTPTSAGWQFTVIGFGTTQFTARPVGGPAVDFAVNITSDSTLIPTADVIATYEPSISVIGTAAFTVTSVTGTDDHDVNVIGTVED